MWVRAQKQYGGNFYNIDHAEEIEIDSSETDSGKKYIVSFILNGIGKEQVAVYNSYLEAEDAVREAIQYGEDM